MRIAFIGQKGIPAFSGGVEKHVEEISTRMAKMEHEVFVYARNNYTDKNLKGYKGVRIINLPSIPTKNLDAISHTFLATIHALFQKYDVIHYQAIGPTSLSFIPKILKRNTLIASTFHCQDYFHQKWGWFAKAYLKLGEYLTCKVPHLVVSVGKTLHEYARKKYKLETVLISNGAAANFNPKTQALDRWNIKEKKYVLSVSRLVKHKGIHYLIEAWKKMEDTGKIPSGFKLLIVGEGSHTDEYVQYLKKMTEGRENIIFTGTQSGSSLEQIFSHAYLFVQPSEYEGLSISLLEAMAYGVAPLVSDIPENLEAINASGISFKNKDTEDLENKLAYLLNNPEKAEISAKNAKKRAEKEYSWNSIAQKTIEAYRDELIKLTDKK